MGLTKPFAADKFVRESISVSMEERDCEKRDLEEEEQSHYLDADFQQVYLDPYIMRRFVIDIVGRQECDTISLLSNDVADYLDLDEVTPPDMLISGGTGGAIPSGKYLITSFNVSDRADGFSVAKVGYRQYGPWTKIAIEAEPSA